MGNIRSSLADVSVHLAHHTDMLVAVEQGVFLITVGAAASAMRGAESFQACMRQDDDQALGLFIVGGDGDMLLGDQLRQFGRRARLGP